MRPDEGASSRSFDTAIGGRAGAADSAGHEKATTIIARASGEGRAAISLFRASGAGAFALLERLGGCALPPARHARLVTLYDPRNGEFLDRALIICFPAPASYTGEETVEFHLHGGRATARLFLDAVLSVPWVRLAEPGEFTRQAFFNGKLDLTEAEGLADLIDAETKAQHRLAHRQLSGEVGKHFRTLRASVLEIRALVEASIDFSDEGEIGSDLMVEARNKIADLAPHLDPEPDTLERAQTIRDGLRIVLAGAPNAGKSSLFNALLERDGAIVSSRAGTTRDLLEASMTLAGVPVHLFDGAGLAQVRDPIEREGIRRAEAAAREADLVLWIAAPDAAAFPKAVGDYKELWRVGSKSDAPGRVAWPKALADRRLFSTSVRKAEGLQTLRQALADYAASRADLLADGWVLQARHQDHLASAHRHLLRTLSLIDAQESDLALIAEALRACADSLGKITGAVGVEEVYDLIFSRFCLGK